MTKSKWLRTKKNNGPHAKARRIIALAALDKQLEIINNSITRDKETIKDYKNPNKKQVLEEEFIKRNILILEKGIEKDYPKKIARIKKEIEILKTRI